MVRTVPPRSEIPEEYTWDIASIFPSDELWEEALQQLGDDLPRLDRFRGHLGDGPEVLLDYLRTVEELAERLGKVSVYASTGRDVDTTDQVATARYERANGIWSRFMAAVSFGEPEMLGIGHERLQEWMRRSADLRLYEHYFDALFSRRAHVRTPEVEEVLGLVADPFSTASDIHGVLADADLTFRPARTSGGEEIQIAQGNVEALISDSDRELRRTAWENYADAYLAMKNTMASCLTTGVKQHVFSGRVRRYDSVLEAALAPNHIPTQVFYSLIDAFRRNLPTWHRYWEVKRRALGYDTFHVYDVRAPLITESPEVPYQQAIEWILEGMRPLGEEYVEVMRRGLTEQRWVDVYPNQNKASGAYSGGSRGTHPFILTSYTDDIVSMSVLAHELGHSMHSYNAWKTQPAVYANYGVFVAEVASNFNQAMVRRHLLESNPDPSFQIALIEEAMSNFHRYFFIMPTLARFELEIHERVWRGEALTADGMSRLLTDLFREGYGNEVEVDEPRVGITWGQFPLHLYANFYVYQYATGISAAQALADGVLEGKPAEAEHYLNFLKAGSSLYPLDALKLAGVDMTSPEPVERAFRMMAEMVERLATLLQEREVEGAARA